jgi:16S rRNA (adenine1518-N6/adenine1519-N6)-dimethyltransferase
LIARKRFGQHFLDSAQVITDITAAINPAATDHVVEIGPGRGALTESLYGRSNWLTLVEIDRDLIPGLTQRFGTAQLYNVDVLEFDFADLEPRPLRVVGNLPYNISTPLLMRLIAFESCITDMHFMLQKEVAERITATPGNKDWGRLSVLLQYHCETEWLFDVAPECFRPPPAVWSAVIRLRPRHLHRAAVNLGALDQVLKAVFGQRRKQLGNTLKNLLPLDTWRARGANIDFTARAESVTLATFIALANALADDGAAR